MTLAFENVDSKLLDDVSVADERVDKSLVEILILSIGQYIKAEVWSRF